MLLSAQRAKSLLASVSRGFSSSPSPRLVSINSEEDWESHVLKQKDPVILDFYADWCGPCKKLYPLMTALVKEDSPFTLAKVNIDEMGEVASAMGVQSIPHVFLIHDSQVLDSFVGIPSSEALKAFFDKAASAAKK